MKTKKRLLLLSSIILLLAIFILPAASSIAQEQAPPEEEKSGLVTMDFEDADIRDVIKVLALASGMNMVIGKDIEAKVTLFLKDVPWEKALDIVLRTYNFTYKTEKNLIRIMTFEKVKQEERDIPLMTKIVYLNFADVEGLKDTLTKMLSDRGSIEVDARTNSMLITDIPAKVEDAEKIAKKLDTRTPQVLIEAMLVDVKLSKDDELGINWKIIDYFGSDVNQNARADLPDYIELPSTMNISNEAIGFGWIQRIGQYKIDGLIKAWVQDAKANILASPKIVTLDNQTARIEIKSQAPYTQSTSSDQGGTTTSTQFKDVTTGLEVTPHITKEGFISMNIKPKQEFIESYVGSTNEPQIGSRSAETNVLVENGQTIVIGGLRKIEDTATIVKVPILGDIPILGNFFRKKDLQQVNTELVMFVTPHIITQPELTDEEIERYEMLDQAREKFLKQRKKEKEKRLKIRKKQARVDYLDIVEAQAKEALPEAAAVPLIKERQIEPPVRTAAAVKKDEIEIVDQNL